MKKLAAKRAEYDQAMRQQPEAKRQSKPRWVKHVWDEQTDTLKTSRWPGCFPYPGKNWHREGSLDEIEQRENAGQRSLF
jgi:hypothetical protein